VKERIYPLFFGIIKNKIYFYSTKKRIIAMKKLLLLSVLSCFATLQTLAQIDLNIGYGYSRPSGQMSANIKGVHGLNMVVGYHLPKTPIMVGIELGLGGYGYQTQRQTYTFSDGTTTETNVNVSNNVFSLMLNSRIYYPTEAIVQPYLQFRGGLSNFYTSLTIEDPTDADACHPLESDILKSSSNIAGSVGIGARINLSKNSGSDTKFGIDISANYLNGGKVSYMSLNKATQKIAPVGEVSAEFVNTTNQVHHKHHVGYVYKTPIQLFDWRIGMFMQF
jgi:hypothetical protein